MRPIAWLSGIALLAACALALPATIRACPFCTASPAATLSEDFRIMDAVIIAELLKTPEDPDPKTGEFKKTPFKVVRIIKGEQHLRKSSDAADAPLIVEAAFFGRQKPGDRFLLLGTEPPSLNWNTPVPLSKRAEEYMAQLLKFPETGSERLAFYQDYLEDGDSLLSRDAYDEFAKSSYKDVQGLKPKMKRQQLIEWIQDPGVQVSHRRLYFTMLGICGKPEDADLLERMLTAKSDEPKTGLDAMIACYLTLKGPDGLPLIERLFLADAQADYSETYSAIMALRFHGQEEDLIPRERILGSLRLMLDRPNLADLVIPDLARWQDWSVMDKLVELFRKSDEKTTWVRVPVVQYLQACPLPEAAERIAELQKIDPEAVRRANLFMPLAPKRAADTKDGDIPNVEEPKAESATGAKPETPRPETPRPETPSTTPEDRSGKTSS